MKNYSLVIVLIGLCSESMAQAELKLYQNSDFYTATYSSSNSPTFTKRYANFTRISIAISIPVKGFVHELELFVPDIHRSDKDVSYPATYGLSSASTTNNYVDSYSFRYDVSKKFYQEGKFVISLGAGINPYYVKFSYLSSTSNIYNQYRWFRGAVLNLIPRLSYSVSTKVRLDLSFPINVFEARNAKLKVDNPAIPYAQQTNQGWEYRFFENAYTIRVGIAWNLSKP